MESPFLEAAAGKQPRYTPVWFMRQAGRCLPEYRKTRGSTTLLEAVSDSDLATELTLQPVRRYGVDAAIVFSDILVPLWSIGFGVDIKKGIGPVVEKPFSSDEDLDRIRPHDPEDDTPFTLETISKVANEILGTTPVIGFVGAPFTVACYLIEGGPSKNQMRTKALMHSRPDLWNALMARLADVSIASAIAQVKAGADAIQIFDSLAGTLSAPDYESFVVPHLQRIFSQLAPLAIYRISYIAGNAKLLPLISASGADVIGCDWRTKLTDVKRMCDNKPVQGNLDPAICLADWRVIENEVHRVLQDGGGMGHIFNLGNGVAPDTDPGILEHVVDLVHNWRPTIN